MAQLKLFVLGPPRLEAAGVPIDLALRKALALVVYLAVSGQPHSRDALATLLWPESDQREGRARLRRTLHRLGQALGASVLDAEGDTIRLRAGAPVALDSALFLRHAAAGLRDAVLDEEALPDARAHLAAAAELYADDFLAGFTLPDSPAFDEWQFFQREGLRQTLAHVLERLAALLHRWGEFEQAIPYARRLVALDPLHEPHQPNRVRGNVLRPARTSGHPAAGYPFQARQRGLRRESPWVTLPPSSGLWPRATPGR
ncbi:MAG TPA: BTAD domain-containing putative transcriptional regulator [Roseiflexaceae bacterium]|nr:BTAD domain-containing putative transcriptional regulator [Roseiflexaceae bacterium]